jgi:DNA helicase II / ATP-dependent DNA helicase PcrA
MSLLSGLNDRQREAVEAVHGPVLILAGAGSGKTKALTHRMAYLIKEKAVRPWNILAVTFTNKAAGEMKERVLKLVAGDLSEMPTIGTFHSVCVQLLRREAHMLGYENQFTIFDDSDQLALLKRIMKRLGIGEKEFNPKAIRNRISALKNLLKTPEDAHQAAMDRFNAKVASVYVEYQKALRAQSAMDFDDLIMQTVVLFQEFPAVLLKCQHRWQFTMVDEYQDTNFSQYQLIKLITQSSKNLCVVGDPDQNIYSWRGADISYIMRFSQDYPEAVVVRLEQNYRSTSNILSGAEAVIEKNKGRLEKKLWTENPEGEKISLMAAEDEREEAEWVLRSIQSKSLQLGDNVVLYRTNAQSRQLEEACLRYGVPYKVIGGVKFYARKEIKDMVAYLRLILNSKDDAALLRIINTPGRKIGAKTLEVLQAEGVRTGMNLLQVMDIPRPPKGGVLDALHSGLNVLSEPKWEVLQRFVYLIESLREFSREFPVSTLIKEVLLKSGYKEMLEVEGEEGEVRLENIMELVSVASKYNELEAGVGLMTFLEEVSLVSDTDELQGKPDYVTLMTLHAAKGLEFPNVYIVGLEEGIFPSSRSFYDPEQAAEERRLMYVGMTRAERNLCLVWAKRRFIYGETSYNPPSSFLKDIPASVSDGDVLHEREEDEMVERIRQWDWNGKSSDVSRQSRVEWSGESEKNDEFRVSNDESMLNSEFRSSNVPSFHVGDRVEHKMLGWGR